MSEHKRKRLFSLVNILSIKMFVAVTVVVKCTGKLTTTKKQNASKIEMKRFNDESQLKKTVKEN